ncbi:hypothetical protein C8Q80DRAFT_619092 [Daedaleopsis nitida]|nr:hypothetical protein C8Q80DRAFT_619092 [Daedaleopsis nitida]
MNSSRARYNHVRPSNPMDIMAASTQAGMANMRAKMNQIQEDERIAQGQCTYCGEKAGDTLKSCARCRAARYCNQTCQLADFKGRHKRECSQFAAPPITTAFLTKPVANERFPQQPPFVQNRRKEKAPVVVFGSCAQVVGYPSVTSSILRGSAQNDNLSNTRDRISYVAAGVINDPWDKGSVVSPSLVQRRPYTNLAQ